MLAKITGYVNITSGNITAVKAAIYKHGPVAVSIDASHKTFSFYSNGIYYEPKCGESSGTRGAGGPGCPGKCQDTQDALCNEQLGQGERREPASVLPAAPGAGMLSGQG